MFVIVWTGVLCSVLLLLSCPLLISASLVLVRIYHFYNYGFFSELFLIYPPLITGSGCFNLFLGFLVSVFLVPGGSRFIFHLHWFVRILLLVNAGLLGYGCWLSMEIRTQIVLDLTSIVNTRAIFDSYHADPEFKDSWDRLQREFYCCGALNFYTGYRDWYNYPYGLNNSVPDSCCTVEVDGCGTGVLSLSWTSQPTIYNHGCLTLMQRKLENEVMDLMIGLTGVLAVSLLASVVNAVLSLNLTYYRNKGEESGEPVEEDETVPSAPIKIISPNTQTEVRSNHEPRTVSRKENSPPGLSSNGFYYADHYNTTVTSTV